MQSGAGVVGARFAICSEAHEPSATCTWQIVQ
jgi:hypothetical protein